jgi:hypothetical protein
MKKTIYALTFVSVMNLLSIIDRSKYQTNNIESVKLDFHTIFSSHTAELELLFFQIVEAGIRYPDIVLAQAILESGHLGSQIFVENNNLFGMRFPRQRETVATGNNKGYSVYNCWTDSVKDYKLFQDYLFRNNEKTKEEYFDYLQRVYAEDPRYVHFVKKIMENTKDITNTDFKKHIDIKNKLNLSDFEEKLCEFINEKKIV